MGTGIGYWVRFWRSMGIARVDGCDLVPTAVDAASKAAREVGAEGDYVVANLAVPRCPPGRTYGLVSCFNVLLHLVDDDAFSVALGNVAGLVADGGYLVLAEPILLDPSFERPCDPARASRARPLDAYRDGLVAAGLELVALEPATVLANNPKEARSVRRCAATSGGGGSSRTRPRPHALDRAPRRGPGPSRDPDRAGAHDEVRRVPAAAASRLVSAVALHGGT